MKLYWSTKSQVDIVKETVDYIIKNQSVPIANIIDKNVKELPLSVVEYSNILYDEVNKLPKQMKNYKLS